jgi:hypothetical protein
MDGVFSYTCTMRLSKWSFADQGGYAVDSLIFLFDPSHTDYLPSVETWGNIIGGVATILVIWIATVKYRRNRRQLARTYAEYPRKAVPELDRGAKQRNVMVIGGAGFLGYLEWHASSEPSCLLNA